jgi:hypothetical protein
VWDQRTSTKLYQVPTHKPSIVTSWHCNSFGIRRKYRRSDDGSYINKVTDLKMIGWMLVLRLIKLYPNVWMQSLQFLDQLVRIDYISENWSIKASRGDGMQYNFVSDCNSSLMCTCCTQIYKLNQFRHSTKASIADHSFGHEISQFQANKKKWIRRCLYTLDSTHFIVRQNINL